MTDVRVETKRSWGRIALAWTAVLLPLLWGVYMTMQRTLQLFQP